MLDFLFKSSALELVSQADFFTKTILFLLFLASVLCMAIVALKFTFFRKEFGQMKALLKRTRGLYNLNEVVNLKEESLGGRFLQRGLKEYNSLHVSGEELDDNQLHRLETFLHQSTEDTLLEAEAYMPVLGISAAVSPLVGLFGTIWGLMHAFVSISSEKSADLSVVAPGIAEALTTTLAGLVVAIPAMIFFHYFSNELRKLEQTLLHLSSNFYMLAKQSGATLGVSAVKTSATVSGEQ